LTAGAQSIRARDVAEIDTCINYSRASEEETKAERLDALNRIFAGFNPVSPFFPRQLRPPIFGGEAGGEGEISRFESDYQFDVDSGFHQRSRDFWTAGYRANISEGRGDSKGACLDARPLLIDRLVTEPWNIYGLSLLLSRFFPSSPPP